MTLLESLQDVSVLVLTENHSIKPFDCEDDDLNEDQACRVITVDAYAQAVNFYHKIGFEFLTKLDEKEETRLMFLDLTSFI